MKLKIVTFFLLLIALARCKPTSNYCKACTNLVTFSKLLSQELKSNHAKDDLVDWCKNVSDGSTTESCLWVITNMEDMLFQVNSDQFCNSIEACYSLSYQLESVTNVSNNEVTCNLCMDIVKHLKDIVSSSQTENEVKDFLESMCNFLKSLQDECIKLVLMNVDEIFTFLKSHLNPKPLCQELGCCSKLNAKVSIALLKPPQLHELIGVLPVKFEIDTYSPNSDTASLGDDCEMCKMLFEILYKELENDQNEKAIQKLLDKVCTLFFKKETSVKKCADLVNSYEDMIINLITQSFQPNLACSLIGLCSDRTVNVAIQRSNMESSSFIGPQCPLCKMVVSSIYKYIGNNKTKEAIVHALDYVCDSFSTKYSHRCEIFIAKYTEKLVKIILWTDQPELVCSLMFLCQNYYEIESESFVEVSIKNEAIISPECIICHKLMKIIYNLLEKNETEEEIENFLEKICYIFPNSQKERCINFINQNFQQLIDLIAQAVPPNEACLLMKACNQVEKDYEREDIINNQETSLENVENSKFCDICRQILSNINKQVLKFNESFDMINHICKTHRNEEYRKKCIKFLDKYSEKLATILEQMTDSDAICKMLHVCFFLPENDREVLEEDISSEIIKDDIDNDVNLDKEKKPIENSIHDHEFCYECQLIAHFIQEELYDYHSEQVITDYVKKHLCNHLVPILKLELCSTFIDKYGDALIQVIAQKMFDPKVFCDKELKLCPASFSSDASKTEFEISLLTPDKEETCQLCLDVVNKLDSTITKDVSKNFSVITSEKICKDFHIEKQKTCKTMFDGFGALFIHLVGYLDGANKICKTVDLCIGSGYSRLLGGQKCTFGPTYWCHTVLHAQACKATDYCKNKVWKAIE